MTKLLLDGRYKIGLNREVRVRILKYGDNTYELYLERIEGKYMIDLTTTGPLNREELNNFKKLVAEMEL